MSTSVKVTKTRTSEGPAGSMKTSSYQTTTSMESDSSYRPVYKSQMTPRNTTFVQRTSMSGPVGSVMSRSVQRSMSYGQPNIAAHVFSTITSTGVNNVRETRVQEKKDMQDLNERFANYIEKVRFLEAQNRRLADELEKLKAKWGKETSAVKAMYQAELDEARRLLDEAEKEKARLEIRCSSLEEQIDELRTQLDDLTNQSVNDRERLERQNQQLSEYEAEINLLRRRVESLENDREKDKKEIARLQEALNRARIDLDNESLNHIDAENRRQTLEEEIEFMKQVHEQEMKELAALAYRDTTAENREFWKSEMSQALREIQETYDEKLDSMRGELEGFYNFKIQEMRNGATRQNMESAHSKEESKRLRQQLTDMRARLNELETRNAQLEREVELLRREYEEKEREWELETTELKTDVAKLRAEMEAMLKELQDLLDTKLGLELEIAAYRKLLEGEESRYSTTVSILGRLSELIPAASSTHQMHISSSKHSSKSKNQTPEAFSEATVASSQQDVSGGAEFTAMVALPPKHVESESESTSAEFQIGMDMLANIEDTAPTGETESVAHSEAFIEMPQSDATVEQSSVEFKSDVIQLEQEQEQKAEQEEAGKQSASMSVDLMGSETVSVVKSESESGKHEAQMQIELTNGNEMKSETIVAELQSTESASIAEVNSVAISSGEGTSPTDEVAEGIRP